MQPKEPPIDIANGIVQVIDNSVTDDDGNGSTVTGNWKGER